MSDLLKRIELLRKKADNIEQEFLIKAGWEYTCQTPGSYWLWKKTLSDGTHIMVNQPTAMRIQTEEDIS